MIKFVGSTLSTNPCTGSLRCFGQALGAEPGFHARPADLEFSGQCTEGDSYQPPEGCKPGRSTTPAIDLRQFARAKLFGPRPYCARRRRQVSTCPIRSPFCSPGPFPKPVGRVSGEVRHRSVVVEYRVAHARQKSTRRHGVRSADRLPCMLPGRFDGYV